MRPQTAREIWFVSPMAEAGTGFGMVQQWRKRKKRLFRALRWGPRLASKEKPTKPNRTKPRDADVRLRTCRAGTGRWLLLLGPVGSRAPPWCLTCAWNYKGVESSAHENGDCLEFLEAGDWQSIPDRQGIVQSRVTHGCYLCCKHARDRAIPVKWRAAEAHDLSQQRQASRQIHNKERNPRPCTRNPKLETYCQIHDKKRNPRPCTRNPKPKT
jgi:hypothetical protein